MRTFSLLFGLAALAAISVNVSFASTNGFPGGRWLVIAICSMSCEQTFRFPENGLWWQTVEVFENLLDAFQVGHRCGVL